MKTIKKYWAIIVGAILAAFGIGIAVNKKLNDKKIADSDKKIADNKQQADVISGKVDAIASSSIAAFTRIVSSSFKLYVT